MNNKIGKTHRNSKFSSTAPFKGKLALPKNKMTSWDNVGDWYSKLVGKEGHFYHKSVIVPNSLKLLRLDDQSSLLDIGCGQGFFSNLIPSGSRYFGVDNSRKLIDKAVSQNKNATFAVSDLDKPVQFNVEGFTHACMILSLQNMENPATVVANCSRHLKREGRLLIVLNHPCFRIPRQTSWGFDDQNKMQFRRVNRYMSALKVPISMHPGNPNSELTWSFHMPLQAYSRILHDNGFVIDQIEEWVSEKQSEGFNAKQENRARSEFPLFMAILCKKER